MKFKRFASIDIGTNTILMMISELDFETNEFRIIGDFHAIARLGENLNERSEISQEAIIRASDILEEYYKKCKELQVERVFAVGTSALRDANNAESVCQIFSNIIKTNIKIISGEEEAFLSFLGTVTDNNQSVVIDIGGGSTEIISGFGNTIINRQSINIGAVRLTEMFFKFHPPNAEELDNARSYIRINLKDISTKFEGKKYFAVAGTPTTLASIALGDNEYNSNRVNGYNLNITQIDILLKEFLSLPVNQIVSKFNIHPKRADVITMGSIILQEILNGFKINSCIVSSNGLRYGIIKNYVSNLITIE